MKILIVDDNEADLFYNEVMLGDNIDSVEVKTAVDGQHALEVLKDFAPDIILLDINMPRMNGHEFLKKYESECQQNVPIVVMLTTSQQEEDKETISHYDFVIDYFLKPLSEDSIAKMKAMFD